MKMGNAPIGYHPSEFIDEELSARGWTRQDLAIRIHWGDIAKTILALELYSAVADDALAADCTLGPLADDLDRVFGCAPGFFAALEASYKRKADCSRT